MKPIRERSLPVLGVVSTAVMTLAAVVALNADKVPFLGGGGVTYAADFTEAAGLTDSAEVRVTGVKVGEVRDVTLEGDHIRVEFTVRDVPVGDRSSASIEIKTLLGQKYLALSPAGDAPQDPHRAIPRERTRVPYDLSPVLNDLTTTVRQVDTAQLAKSFRTISDTFANTGPGVKSTLDGVTRLSTAIAARDEQLTTLLRNASQLSGTLAGRDEQVRSLLTDGQALLAEIQRRKGALEHLLGATTSLANQLHGVVGDNSAQLGPALDELGKVTDLLKRNQANLEKGLHNLAPFARLGTNALGNGRWFEVYMCGLLPPVVNAGPLSINPQGCLPPSAKGDGK